MTNNLFLSDKKLFLLCKQNLLNILDLTATQVNFGLFITGIISIEISTF